MRKTIHLSVDIAGMLRNYGKRSMRGLITEDNGAEWTDGMVRKYLKECLDRGWKLLPVGKECEGYSHETGCPGHPVNDEVSEIDTDCVGNCYSDADSGL